MRVTTCEYVFNLNNEDTVTLGLPEADGCVTLSVKQFTDMKQQLHDDGYVVTESDSQNGYYVYGRVFDVPGSVLEMYESR